MSKIEMKCEDLLAILKALSRLASTNRTRPHFMQIAIRGPRWMVTNGHMLAWIHTDPAIEGETAIPMSTVAALVSILRAPGVRRGFAEIDTGFREVKIPLMGLRLSWCKPDEEFPPVHKIVKEPPASSAVTHIGLTSEYTRVASAILSDLGFSAMHVDLRGELEPIILTGAHGGGVGSRGKTRDCIKRASVLIMPVRMDTTDKALGEAYSITRWVAECEAAEAAAAEARREASATERQVAS